MPAQTEPDPGWISVGIVGGIVSLLTLVALAVAVTMWRRRWLVADLPTSDAAHVFVGMNEVVGVAEPVREPLIAPFSAMPCVWYKARLEREEGKGDERRWKKVSEVETGTPFWIADRSGKVLVRPRGAAIELPKRAHRTTAGPPPRYDRLSVLHQVEAFERREERRRHGFGSGDPPLPPLDDHQYRTNEWWIEVGESLYLLGEATLRDDVVALEFAPGDPVSGVARRRLLITSGSPDQVAGRAGWLAMASLVVAITGAYALPQLWSWFQAARDQNPLTGQNPPMADATLASVVAVGIVLAAFLAGYGLRLHNRLVAVAERVTAAWSLIDVQLRRRHDLLPNLAAVVAAAAAHEREVQVLLAEIRSRAALPPTPARPDDAAVERAAQVDAADSSVARQLLALAEAYPTLTSGERFAALQRELTETEDAIAFARSFYNDAVRVQRDRFGTFPGTLLRGLVRGPVTGLLSSTDAPERRAAEVPVAPPDEPAAHPDVPAR